tara:strand:+ start:2722 stop:2928 length:207 start_codon:yes stop_codon:yes gene_type:complete
LKRIRFVTNFAAQQEMMSSSSMSRCLFFFFQKYLRIAQIWQKSLRRVFVLRVVPMMLRGVDDDDDEAF